MFKILVHCFGTNKEGLFSETRKVYGFDRSGQNIITSMNAACDLLLNQGRAKIVDGKIVVCNQ